MRFLPSVISRRVPRRGWPGLPGLDLVPARWLHLTTQGVGFTVEVASG